MTKTVRPLPAHIRSNFETLQRAQNDGNLTVVSAIRKEDQTDVALICAVSSSEDGKHVNIVPFGMMLDCDPYETFQDPTIGKTRKIVRWSPDKADRRLEFYIEDLIRERGLSKEEVIAMLGNQITRLAKKDFDE